MAAGLARITVHWGRGPCPPAHPRSPATPAQAPICAMIPALIAASLWPGRLSLAARLSCPKAARKKPSEGRTCPESWISLALAPPMGVARMSGIGIQGPRAVWRKCAIMWAWAITMPSSRELRRERRWPHPCKCLFSRMTEKCRPWASLPLARFRHGLPSLRDGHPGARRRYQAMAARFFSQPGRFPGAGGPHSAPPVGSLGSMILAVPPCRWRPRL